MLDSPSPGLDALMEKGADEVPPDTSHQKAQTQSTAWTAGYGHHSAMEYPSPPERLWCGMQLPKLSEVSPTRIQVSPTSKARAT